LGRDPMLGPRSIHELGQMAEDIEIMRRLLNQKLGKAQPAKVGSLGSGNWFPHYQFQGGYQPYQPLQPFQLSGNVTWNQVHRLSGCGGSSRPTQPSQEADGVYLKGQGVVYPISLPPLKHDPRSSVEKSEAKPASDWERTRSHLRGEKAAEPKATQSKEPSL